MKFKNGVNSIFIINTKDPVTNKSKEPNKVNESTTPNSSKKTESTKTKIISYPCGIIRKQLSFDGYHSKIEELNQMSKTHNTSEAGYAYDLTHGFQKLKSAKNGHSLSYNGMDLNNILGFIHTHPCGKNFLYYGSRKVWRESIPMPSPTDVNVFKKLLMRAKINDRKLENVFMTVVSCFGIYDLKYKGNGENIRNWDMTEKTYKSYFNKTINPVKAFKKYLEEVVNQHGNGFELFEYKKEEHTNNYKFYRPQIIGNKLYTKPMSGC